MSILDILDRIWSGRNELRRLHVDPNLENVDIVMSVHAHMVVMSDRASVAGIVELDNDAPAGIRIWGLPVRRDPTFDDNEIRFRSEVAL